MPAAVRGTLPLLTALLLVLLSVTPLRLPDLSMVTPNLALIAVYYWGIHRPDLLPAPAAFLVGLTLDALGGTPLGLMALVLLLVQGVAVTQGRVFTDKSFVVGWFGFMVVAVGAFALSWVLAMLWLGELLAIAPVVHQCGLTIALYPGVGWLLARLNTRALSGL